MYTIKIGQTEKGIPLLKGNTESKGEARAVASFCAKNKIPYVVFRQVAEVEVKYTFTTDKK